MLQFKYFFDVYEAYFIFGMHKIHLHIILDFLTLLCLEIMD